MIDLYCERLTPGLLAEPLNALTNLAFIAAALASLKLARRLRCLDSATGLLIGLMFAIGIGSGLFHTFASGWAQLADVIPIMLFQLCFLLIYCRQLVRLSWLRCAAALLVFVGAGLLAGRYRPLFNGSVVYLPAFALLLILGGWHLRARMQAPFALLAASLVFLLSLSFRTLDLALCPSFPSGTHFLWHLLNGLLLWLLMLGLLRNYPSGR